MRSGGRIADQFELRGNRVWLDTAHQGVLPKSAAAAAREAILLKREPWRMTMEQFSRVPSQLRERLGRLLSAPLEEIVLANSNSYGLHLLANGYPWRPGDEVLLVRGDFPSTILPWRGLEARGVRARLIEPLGPVVTVEDIERHLSPQTRVFCTTWVHSFTGYVVDERAIGEFCRNRGVHFVLNASQGLGARGLTVTDVPVDALTCAGFKWLCGPYGTGFCWIRADLLEVLEYNQTYWLTLQRPDDLETDEEPRFSCEVGARRYDVFGTANFFNFTSWTAALDVMFEAGLQEIIQRIDSLGVRFFAGLDETRFEILSPRHENQRSSFLFVSHREPDRNRTLYEQLAVCGIHCAIRRGKLRFSPHFYNSAREIDRTLEVLHEHS